jgi:hypothetical protein
MHPRVHAAFTANHGLLTRWEAHDLGVDSTEVRAFVRTRRWHAVRRGVYCERETWEGLDEFRGRPLLQARAAVKSMRRSAVLSHDSSAHALGLDILAPAEPFVHVTRPGFTNAWTEHGIKYHLARYRADQVVERDGLSCLDLARTAVDIARERGFADGVCAMDAALRAGVRRQQLREASEPMVNWPGVRAVREATEFADAGAESVAESLARILVAELGAGRVQTQFPLRLGDSVVWCDLLVGRHVVEVDGKVKYRAVEDGGVAKQPAADVVMAEKSRQRDIEAEGLGVSRLFWADFWGARRQQAKARLRADLAVTNARLGTVLPPHLVRNAAEIRARRGA